MSLQSLSPGRSPRGSSVSPGGPVARWAVRRRFLALSTLLLSTLLLSTLLLLAPFPLSSQAERPSGGEGRPSGGEGTFYVSTYRGSLYVLEEADFQQRNEIPLPFGIPTRQQLSQNRRHLYVQSADFEKVAVVDLESEEVTSTFDLRDGRKRVKLWGMSVAPDESYALFVVKSVTKELDRFEIGDPTLLRYDLEERRVLAEVPWPDDKQREFAQVLFSPDGKSVFFLGEEIIVYDAETFEEIDRWKYGRSWGEGLGDFRFGFPQSLQEDPGFYSGLFRVTDPVQNRRLMGVARVDLSNRDVDFFVLGPAEPVSFSMAPDRRTAYGLHQRVGDYQLWTFDLERRRVASKVEFAGRPRMSLSPSSNGELLYIYGAGSTFDVYRADGFEHLYTHELDADMIGVLLLPPSR